MRIAVFSDIHGNFEAINSVMDLIGKEQVDHPYYQLADMETDVFSKAVKSNELQNYDLVVIGHVHKNFVNENVVGVSATGIDQPTFLLIEIDEKVSYRYVSGN